MLVAQATETDYDNLIWEAFEKVSSDADKAHRRLNKIREGTASSQGLDANETLKLYRKTLVAALAALDKAIEE